MTSGSDYPDLTVALSQACNTLVGTAGIVVADCAEVVKATTAVEMGSQPVAGFNTEAPVCSAGQTPSNIFFDTLEAGAGAWGATTLTGTNRWSYGSPYGRYAHSGVGFLYADDFPEAVSDSAVSITTGVLLPANAFLHFAHAFGFEQGSRDGGVVEYSTNNGASWIDAGTLFDSVGYNGTIASGFGNPLAGRAAFVDSSHGYRASRANLSSLAGQSVRFRWRMGIDGSVYNWGWWLDDVPDLHVRVDRRTDGNEHHAE